MVVANMDRMVGSAAAALAVIAEVLRPALAALPAPLAAAGNVRAVGAVARSASLRVVLRSAAIDSGARAYAR